MKLSLVMVKGDGSRRDFPLTKERVVVGRTNDCDLRVPLPSVSRHHCEIYQDNGSVKLRDLGSSNGTFHNNTRVQEATLEAGDSIGVGPVVFRIIIDGQPASMPEREVSPGGKSAVGAGAAGAAGVPGVRPQPVQDQSDDAIVDAEEDLPSLLPDDSPTPQPQRGDDPIAALEAMAATDDSGNLEDLEDLDDLPVLDAEEEEEDPKPPRKKT